jgi:hypothetical protein
MTCLLWQIASLLACIALVDFIISVILVPGLFVFFLIIFLLTLLLPACGYFGVRNRSIWLVHSFVFCNACLFVLQIASIVTTLVNDQRGGAWVAAAIGILFALINFFGCYYGYQLTSKAPEFFRADIPVAAPAAAHTVIISAQPPAQGPPPGYQAPRSDKAVNV